MASKTDSTKGIITPLAAAFLTTAPDDDERANVAEAGKMIGERRQARVSETKLSELTVQLSREETKAMLKEQLLDGARTSDKLSAKAALKPAVKTVSKPVPAKEEKPAAKADSAAEAKPVQQAKPAVEEELTIEYGGASYSREELVARALKIWTSKLKRGRSELYSMELYIKPQEMKVYYVFNKKRNGDFDL